MVVPKNSTAVKLAQEANAAFPIVVTGAGIIIEVRPLVKNAPSPKDINELGNVIEVNAGQL